MSSREIIEPTQLLPPASVSRIDKDDNNNYTKRSRVKELMNLSLDDSFPKKEFLIGKNFSIMYKISKLAFYFKNCFSFYLEFLKIFFNII